MGKLTESRCRHSKGWSVQRPERLATFRSFASPSAPYSPDGQSPQLYADLQNALRDHRFVLATVIVS